MALLFCELYETATANIMSSATEIYPHPANTKRKFASAQVKS
jgi:hypothetical protein